MEGRRQAAPPPFHPLPTSAVERDLADSETARQDAEHGHRFELVATAAQQAERQARHDASLAQAGAARAALEQKLAELDEALQRAEERRESEAAAFADRFSQREAKFTAGLAHVTDARDTLRWLGSATGLRRPWPG